MNNSFHSSWPSGWTTNREIGSGSFGTVYEIQRNLFGNVEKAALKVISIPRNVSDIEDMSSDGYDDKSITNTFHSQMKSIVAEYSLMRKMNGSANIVNCDNVHYEQHSDGIGWDIYIKMELLTPLTKSLPAAISDKQVIKIAKDICAALTLCGKHNIVHRDIKPQNIFVSENGDYKLGDFGIAKTIEKTMGGTKTGTYKYMAPEVYNDKPYNSTADIYSLGLVLYWMLNERRLPFFPLPPAPLDYDEVERAKQRRFSGEKIPAPKHGSKELKRIILKACAYDPKDRYQTAREMHEDLLSLSGEELPMPTPDLIPAPEPNPDDSGTVGPIFKPNPDDGGTVGPIFKPNPDDDGTMGPIFEPVPGPGPEPNPNKKIWQIIVTTACALIVIVAVLIGLRSCGTEIGETTVPTQESAHKHYFKAATCENPKICLLCGETEGDVAGHQWQDATCTKPKTCKVCGKAEGAKVNHQWIDATYEAPKTCKVCGEVSGDVKKNPFSGVKPGDTIRFGEYEQDNNTANGKEDIEWIVLDVQNGKALLLSEYALDSKQYNNADEPITWEECDLRNWLNSSFLKAAFTSQDQKLIHLTKVDNSFLQGNRDWYTQGGNNTEDYVFLLSYAETIKYLNSEEKRICAPTAVAASNREGVTDVKVPNPCWWWLRSPGQDQRQAAFVNYNGTYYTNFVANKYLSVRPAMWMELD